MAKARVTERDEEHGTGGGGTSGARTRSKKGGRKRGRTIVAVLLIGFVLVASVVIWRRSYGYTQSRELGALVRQRTQLEAERARLDGLIRDESSRARLGAVVQRLGMQVPADQQVRILPR